jgi:hypothetical protein
VRVNIPTEWDDRYGKRVDEWRLPEKEKDREIYIQMVGQNEALGIRPRNATANRLIVDSVDHGIRQQYPRRRRNTLFLEGVVFMTPEEWADEIDRRRAAECDTPGKYVTPYRDRDGIAQFCILRAGNGFTNRQFLLTPTFDFGNTEIKCRCCFVPGM